MDHRVVVSVHQTLSHTSDPLYYTRWITECMLFTGDIFNVWGAACRSSVSKNHKLLLLCLYLNTCITNVPTQMHTQARCEVGDMW